MPNPPAAERCVFCNSTAKKTREHIWGDWLKEYVPPSLNKHSILYHELDKPGADPRMSERIRAGDPLNATAKIVCATCNSGWLSILQKSTKPHLAPLLQGGNAFLTPEKQEKIAAWITMATMTAEFLTHNPRQIATTADQRRQFMDTCAPLDGWRIWIGYWQPHKLPQQWVHASLAIYDPEDIPNVEHFDGAPQTNTQVTTVRLGKLFFHVMSSTDPKNIALWDWRDDVRSRALLVPIWPIRDQFIVWPVHGMTDADAYRIGRVFAERVDMIAAALGY